MDATLGGRGGSLGETRHRVLDANEAGIDRPRYQNLAGTPLVH